MVRLSTLGSLEIRGEDGTALGTLTSQDKRVALLVYLAVARRGGMVRRDRLLLLFWPELDDRRARDALNQSLHVLRQTLGPGCVISRGSEEVGIGSACLWCDVIAFDAAIDDGRLEEALELYRGDLFEAVHAGESHEFEEWIRGERERLRARAAQAARTLAERYERERKYTNAVDFAVRALDLTQDERALRRLMELLERAGDHAAALRAYDGFARRLGEELGLVPSAATRQLADRLRTPDPTFSPAAGAAPPMPPRDAPHHGRGVHGPDIDGPSISRSALPKPVSSTVVTPPSVFQPSVVGGALRPQSPHGDLAEAPSIEGYEIIREIDRGGAAIVYLAREVKHGRAVAVKVLRPELAQSLQAERFLREIRITSSLSHPHILPLLDSGRSGAMLYYISPYVEDGSLRRRLDRAPGRQLPIRQAMDIARQVACALEQAHGEGIVHRDVKPENILMSGDVVRVADFGIARAVSLADDARVTLTRLAVGTAPYMSPEQCVGDSEVDARSDVYSLGCVLYEMIAGGPPFRGPHQKVIAQHISAPVPPLRDACPLVPYALEQVVMKALAKEPEDRFASASEMERAIRDLAERGSRLLDWWRLVRRSHRTTRGRRFVHRAKLVAVAVGGIAAGATALRAFIVDSTTGGNRSGVPPTAVLDTTRYAILTPDSGDASAWRLAEAQLVRDALLRWSGLTVADAYQVVEAAGRRSAGTLSLADARRVASDVGAGRYVRLRATQLGDSLRVNGMLFDTPTNRLLADASVRVPLDLANADSAMRALVDALVFRDGSAVGRAPPVVGTRSAPARQAFAHAQLALKQWHLARADSALVSATTHDPEFAQGWLWLAQVRMWMGEPPARWHFAAQRSAAGRSRLAARDQQVADALLALQRRDFQMACGTWRALTRQDEYDFSAWYGLGTCLRSDSVVLPDAGSRARWRFRSSYDEAIGAFVRAYHLLPSIHGSLRGESYADVRRLLLTESNRVRIGHTDPDTLRFTAYPSWDGDSLVFVPVDNSAVANARVWTRTAATNTAIVRQRRLFLELATMWRAAYPQSVDALEAMAVALDLLGHQSAFDTLRVARQRAGSDDDRLRLAALEVALRVKYGTPDRLDVLRAARALADSTLSAHRPTNPTDARLLAALATLTGRAHHAASLSRVALIGNPPFALTQSAPALLTFAALGGPVDSIAALEAVVAAIVDRDLIGAERATARSTWLARAAFLSVPAHDFATIGADTQTYGYQGELMRAWREGDLPRARRTLAELRNQRRWQALDASAVTPDGYYAEAAVLFALGDPNGAAAWLDTYLGAVPAADVQNFLDVARAGPFVRAMALRAEIAAALGEPAEARRWAHALLALWSASDDVLAPVTRRMTELVR